MTAETPIDPRSSRALRARFERIRRLDTRSAEELSQLEEIILGASLCGDPQLEFEARAQWLVSATTHERPRDQRLENLRRCLSHLHAHPGDVSEADHLRCVRGIRDAIALEVLEPDAPAEQIDHLLEVFHTERMRAGVPGHAEDELRMDVALELGDLPEATYRMGLLDDELSDPLASCFCCSMVSLIEIELALRRIHRAGDLALAVGEFAGYGCRSEPHRALAASLIPLTLTGHHPLAREHAESAWPAIVDSGHLHVAAGRVLFWCAWTGQTQRALDLLREYLPVIEENPGATGRRLRFLSSAAYVAHRGALAFGRDTPFAGSALGRLDDAWTLEARALSALFDRRNGTDAVSRRTDSVLTAAPWDRSAPPERPAARLPHRRGLLRRIFGT